MLSGTRLFGRVSLSKKMVMAKWSESQIYKDTRGTNRFTRFVGWLNNLMNPNHAWVSDWNEFSDNTSPSEDIINQVTKSHLTGAENEANAFNASEAQKQRDWETEMQNTAYQRQVADMRAAGVNPALSMSGGAPSTPSGASASSVAPGSGATMSDLMQLFLLPMQKSLMKAQVDNTYASADKQRAEGELAKARTENMTLVNAYYPAVTEAGLEKTLSAIGVDLSTIDKNDAQTALTNVQKLIADKENEYAQAYYKARADYEQAKTEEAKAAAARDAAQALMTGYEYEYAKEKGAKLSSSSILALVSAIGEFTGLNSKEVRSSVQSVVGTAVKESLEPFGMFKGAIENFGPKVKRKFQQFERWRNKEKKAPWVK